MMRDPLNRIIMQDIGLTVNQNNIIMDQDTREVLTYKDKNMRYSSQNSVSLTNQDMVFDPASNRMLMSHLFNHFLNKIEQEDGTYISVYSEDQDKKTGKTAIIAKVQREGEPVEEVKTGYYNNDSLKYAEMVKILNESSDTDLSEYDSEKVPDKVGRRGRRKKVKFG